MAVLAKKFPKPILLEHGDSHRFVIDRPLLSKGSEDEPDELQFHNLTRLQVFGSPEIKSVKVTVDTDTVSVFGFTRL